MSTLLRQKLHIFTKYQFYSTCDKPFKEILIPVPWGNIAGKWWGSIEIKPILCLHGSQDNCGTFDRLIPFLSKDKSISFLAIDFPGHGYSSPHPPGMLYEFLSYPILIKRISEFFKWQTISLMGHSLGAMISFSYAMLYPEKTDFLICIDAFKPLETPQSAESLRKSLDQFIKYDSFTGSNKEPMAYTLDEITQKVAGLHRNGIKLENAHFLFERNIAPSKKFPGKYYFTRDPKLKRRNMFHWPLTQMLKDASRVICPVCIRKASQSSYFEPPENFYSVLEELQKSSKDCDFYILDGTHYLHLDEPEKIGTHINNFLNKHLHTNNINLDSSIFFERKQKPLKC